MISTQLIHKTVFVTPLLLFLTGSRLDTYGQDRNSKPNVLWILIENIGPEFSCYGYPQVQTPNIDELASEGAIYMNAFTSAPVSSPSRSSMITGMYPNAIGVHHHRSHTQLPDSIKTIPELFRETGYYTSLGNGYRAKKDYNFPTKDRTVWDGNDWKNRDDDQPFFAQLTINHSHRGDHWHNPYNSKSWMHERFEDKVKPVDPAKVELPKVIPDNIYTRDDWAKYLNQIQVVDIMVGNIIDRLKEEGLYDNTLIVLMGDNGRDHLMDEYWLYEGGIHVPLIVSWKGHIAPNTVKSDLVSGVDISVSLLNACDIPIPDYMHGIPFLGDNTKKREYVYACRDRIDDAYDMVRCVRSKKFKYIRNFMTDRSYAQHRSWLMTVNPGYPIIKYMAEHEPEQLNPVQKKYTADKKPEEELYDLTQDPEELNNLAGDPAYNKELQKFRRLLRDWMVTIDDKARFREKPENVRQDEFLDQIEFPATKEMYDPSELDDF